MTAQNPKNNYYQMIRAICIVAVIMIHLPGGTLSNGYLDSWLILRQFINFPVAVFFFLAGYFTKIDAQINLKDFYLHRTKRLVVPYLIWSVVYIFYMSRPLTLLGISSDLICGNASAQLYYVVVLTQLMLLAPLIRMLIDRKRYGTMLCVTPLFLLVHYYIAFTTGCMMPLYNCWFVAWFIFFLIGMNERIKGPIKRTVTNIPLWLIIVSIATALMLSIEESYAILNHTSNPGFAMSQIKFSSFLYTCTVILLIVKLADRHIKIPRIVVSLGNYSFGIYFVHILFLDMANESLRYLAFLNLPSFFWGKQIYMFVVTLVGSYLFCWLLYKIIRPKLAAYCGIV